MSEPIGIDKQDVGTGSPAQVGKAALLVPPWVAPADRVAGAENYFLRDARDNVWYIRMGRHSCRVPGSMGFSYIDTILRNHYHDTLLSSQGVSALVGGILLVEGEDDDSLDSKAKRQEQRIATFGQIASVGPAERVVPAGGTGRASKHDPETPAPIPDDGGAERHRRQEVFGHGNDISAADVTFAPQEEVFHAGWNDEGRQVPVPVVSRKDLRGLRARSEELQRLKARTGAPSEKLGIDKELKQIAAYMAEAAFACRRRYLKSPERKAYDKVAAAIKAALTAIGKESPKIAEHLRVGLGLRTTGTRTAKSGGTDWLYKGSLDWLLCSEARQADPEYRGDPRWYRPLSGDQPDLSHGSFARLSTGEWLIECADRSATIPDMKGAFCIAAILNRGGREALVGSLRNIEKLDAAEDHHERRTRVFGEIIAQCSRAVAFEIYDQGLISEDMGWLEREKRMADQRSDLIKLALDEWQRYRQLDQQDCSKLVSWINRNPVIASAKPRTTWKIMDAVYCKLGGDEVGYENHLQESTVFERACAAVLTYRERLVALDEEDRRYRSLVDHNTNAAIEIIRKKLPSVGSDLRDDIVYAQAGFSYCGVIHWSVSC